LSIDSQHLYFGCGSVIHKL